MLYAIGILSLAASVLFVVAAGATGHFLADPKVKAASLPVSSRLAYNVLKGVAVITEKTGQMLNLGLQFKVVPALLAGAAVTTTPSVTAAATTTKAGHNEAVASLGEAVRRKKMAPADGPVS